MNIKMRFCFPFFSIGIFIYSFRSSHQKQKPKPGWKQKHQPRKNETHRRKRSKEFSILFLFVKHFHGKSGFRYCYSWQHLVAYPKQIEQKVRQHKSIKKLYTRCMRGRNGTNVSRVSEISFSQDATETKEKCIKKIVSR